MTKPDPRIVQLRDIIDATCDAPPPSFGALLEQLGDRALERLADLPKKDPR